MVANGEGTPGLCPRAAWLAARPSSGTHVTTGFPGLYTTLLELLSPEHSEAAVQRERGEGGGERGGGGGENSKLYYSRIEI